MDKLDLIGMLNYIRGDVCCTMILAYLMIKVIKRRRRTKAKICFVELIVWMIIYILMYSLSGTFKYGYVQPVSSVYNVVVMLVMVSQTMVAYKWFCYSEIRQNSSWLQHKWMRIAAFAPAGIFCIVSVLSIWTKWIFFIDSELLYHRGSLFFLQYLLVGLYMVATSIKALYKSFRKENYVQKNELFTMFTFILPPTFAIALQAIIPMGIFLVGYGFTISIIMVYLNGTYEMISQDGLTRLNNRTHMSRFLDTRMFEGNDRLYLLLLDANNFKKINDTYGHVEGDTALMRVAKVLTVAAQKYSCYVSRYGGDEFILIQEADSDEQIGKLCGTVHEVLREENAKVSAPYELTVSIGYAKYSNEIKTIPDFIKAADENMLKNKADYHGRSITRD